MQDLGSCVCVVDSSTTWYHWAAVIQGAESVDLAPYRCSMSITRTEAASALKPRSASAAAERPGRGRRNTSAHSQDNGLEDSLLLGVFPTDVMCLFLAPPDIFSTGWIF